MKLDILTLFVVVIVTSTALAAAIAVVAYRRTRTLGFWAAGLMTHALAYLLFMVRGMVSDVLSIVLANILLSMTFALFTQGIAQFQERRLPRLLTWGPVLAVAVLFSILIDNMPLRVIAGGIVFSLQCLIALVALYQYRRRTPGRGQYILMAGFAIIILIFMVRIAATASGQVEMLSIFSSNQIQHVTFISSVVSLMLLATSLLLMVQERSEAALRESQQLLQHRNLELQRYSTDLEGANRRLETLSVTDALTGLLNRRRFDELLVSEWARAGRHGHALAVIMLDIDSFKQFNDHYGHLAGDDCLVKVASVLQGAGRRASDIAARYGGEEFVMILSDTAPHHVAQFAESVKAAIEALAIPHTESSFGMVTVSVGVATAMSTKEGSPLALLKEADDMLYVAKHQGRNRVASAQL